MTYGTNTIQPVVIHPFYIIFLPSETLTWRPKPLGWKQYQPHLDYCPPQLSVIMIFDVLCRGKTSLAFILTEFIRNLS
jgi:hypothetical protein